MEKIIFGFIILISLSIYSQNRYELLENGNEKFYLTDSISKLAKSGLITEHPIVVIDGKPFRYEDLKKQKLPLSKIAIETITPIDKEKGISIYGTYGEAGVIIITTSKTKVYLLEDENESKYYLTESLKPIIQENHITDSPVISIDGVKYNYDRTHNSIILPLKRENIADMTVLNKETSMVVFGKDAVNGAVIITTTKRKK